METTPLLLILFGCWKGYSVGVFWLVLSHVRPSLCVAWRSSLGGESRFWKRSGIERQACFVWITGEQRKG